VIRLATVVTDDVLSVLRTYVDDENRQTRGESKRPDRGTTPASRLPTLFREWVLDVWTLTGPSEGWREQLEERYRSGPVFALLSGLSTGSCGTNSSRGSSVLCRRAASTSLRHYSTAIWTDRFSRHRGRYSWLISTDYPVNLIRQ
jgi:hypothetical protein